MARWFQILNLHWLKAVEPLLVAIRRSPGRESGEFEFEKFGRSSSWFPRTKWNHGSCRSFNASNESGDQSIRSPVQNTRSRIGSKPRASSLSRSCCRSPWRSPTTKSWPRSFAGKDSKKVILSLPTSRIRTDTPGNDRKKPSAHRMRNLKPRSHRPAPHRTHPEFPGAN